MDDLKVLLKIEGRFWKSDAAFYRQSMVRMMQDAQRSRAAPMRAATASGSLLFSRRRSESAGDP
jgi:hypothetical protein